MKTEEIIGQGVIGKNIELSNYEWDILKEAVDSVVSSIEEQVKLRRLSLKRKYTEKGIISNKHEKALINKDVPFIASAMKDDVRNLGDEGRYNLLIIIKSLHKLMSEYKAVDKDRVLASMLHDYDAIAPMLKEEVI